MSTERATMGLACALAALACACGAGGPEERVSIERGLYGKTQTYDDTGSGGTSAIRAELTIARLDGGGGEVVESRSGGFYEVALEPGTYEICVSWGTCSPAVRITDAPVRCDFTAGPCGGWWSCDPGDVIDAGVADAGGPDS